MVISVQCVLLSIPLPICEPTCHPCSGPSVPGTGWLSSCMFNPLPLLIFAVNLCPPFHSRQFVWLSRQHLYICCALKLRKYPLGCWCSVVQSVSPHLPSAGFVGRSDNIRFLIQRRYVKVCVPKFVLRVFSFIPALISFLCVHPCSIALLGLISPHAFSFKAISHPLLSPHTMSLQGGTRINGCKCSQGRPQVCEASEIVFSQSTSWKF